MAIVFVSPKRKQRIFLWTTSIFLILFLIAISLVVLLPEFESTFNTTPQAPIQGVYDAPDININFSILDSPQVKNLEVFQEKEIEFDYIAKDKDAREYTGKISAVSRQQAQTKLDTMGLVVSNLQEAGTGRVNPFTAY